MQASASLVTIAEIQPWRELYLAEMNCQIVHDSLHARAGWTQSWLLNIGPAVVGYGAIAVAGPWKGTRTVFEMFVAPEHRSRVFDLFAALVREAGITAFEVQTSEVLLTTMLHLWCRKAVSDSIVFADHHRTAHPANGAVFRPVTADDAPKIFDHNHEPRGDWLLEVDGSIAATGGILYHYNRPYGDIYMEVSEPFRRRGFGTYLVQELKRICHEGGSVPCARTGPSNHASLKTILKAGFVPCAHILAGPLSSLTGQESVTGTAT